jgi:DNA adenine methylase
MKLPHPIPYQGSKRNLAKLIAPYVPKECGVMFEPFAGSAAMTIYAAHHGMARRFVVGDSLKAIVDLWGLIVANPSETEQHYRAIWQGQLTSGVDYFNQVRARYNQARDPVDLLYLVCRCVKNAVRFNAQGNFTQSVDKRRMGMHPDKMKAAIDGVASLLAGRVEFRHGDWLDTTSDATSSDFVYMDPPYLGTSIGRDKRYHEQLAPDTLISGLEALLDRRIRFALSYDGMTGDKEYGPPLPTHLGLTRLLIDAGRSSQATLVGRSEKTLESLYLSPCVASEAKDGGRKVSTPAQVCLSL